MRNIQIDFTGTMIATVTPDEFRRGERDFWHDGEQWTIRRMQLQKDGSITIEARKSDKPHRDTLTEYPVYTKFSPNRKLITNVGKVQSRRGKRKLVAEDPKPYEPLKGDTDTGLGERRKRYIR